MLSRIAVFLYGSVSYVLFVGTFLYAMGFVAGVGVPKTIDSGAEGGLLPALLINTGLLGLFAVQHLVMARSWFKRFLTRFIPVAAERSTFVLVTCAILILMYWQWRPLPAVVWNVESAAVRGVLLCLAAAGWALALLSTFMIDHFDLFGLRQVILHLKGREYTHKPFSTRGPYRMVRHPLMLGFLVAFWSAPTMTAGHLLFAAATTGFILIAVRFFEEKDLIRMLGDDYRRYMERTPMVLPVPKRAVRVTEELPAA